MAVAVSCRTPAGRAWRSYLAARGRQVLRALALSRRELSLSLVGDAEMRDLNRRYRGRDRATDVLSFALDEGDAAAGTPPLPRAPLGDVVISIETAARQARAARAALAACLDALLIHGVLHLIGYDHEISPGEARRMARRAGEVRRALAAAPAPPRARAARAR